MFFFSCFEIMSQYSSSTKSLVDELLKQKKISFRQQRQIHHALAVGAALPTEAASVSTEPDSPAKKSFTMKTRSVARKETQDEIRQRGGYNVDQFRPGPVVDRDDKKEKLQNKMAFGVENPVDQYRKKKATEKSSKPSPKDRFDG